MDDFIELTEIPDFGSKSVNFGGGLELLMNDKVKSDSGKNRSSSNDLDDLSTLELELNNLTDMPNIDIFDSSPSSSSSSSSASSFKKQNDSDGGFIKNIKTFVGGEPRNTKKDDTFSINVNKSLGEETSNDAYSEQRTWDGFSKLNGPINPDKIFVPNENIGSKDDAMAEKIKLLKKIEALEKKGVEFSKRYNMESPYNEMKCEFDAIMEDKAKQSSIKFQSNMMLSIVNGLEYLNGKFDPFDINLDGWSEQVNDSITDYDDIFGELYEMYKEKTHISPWVRLIFQLGGSGLMVHMTNTMFKSSMPNMDDILKQNPDLMRQFQTAAVNSMGQSNPGFAGFMNGVMNGGMGGMSGMGGMPTSTPTQTPDYFAQSRGGNNTFGANSGSATMMPPPPPIQPHSEPSYKKSSTQGRPDMKGPTDISDILSGLKTKNVNMTNNNTNTNKHTTSNPATNLNINENSTISLNDLKDLSSEGGAIPKKSKRRPRSDKSNTLSLAL